MPKVLAATLTTGQVSDEMSELNSTIAKNSEISQDFTEAGAILKKKWMSDRKDWW